MAKVILNRLLDSACGTVDGMVLRRYRGRVVLQRKPQFTEPRTAAQLATQGRFGGGSIYAAQVKADPALRELYRTRGKTCELNYRQMAIRDFFNAPLIREVSFPPPTALAGGELLVEAIDDFEVIAVTVAVRDEAAAIIAEGNAQLDSAGWRFLLPSSHESKPHSVEVTATDRPGNCTRRVVEFPRC